MPESLCDVESAGFTVQNSPRFGRHLVAAKNISVGDIIVSEAPLFYYEGELTESLTKFSNLPVKKRKRDTGIVTPPLEEKLKLLRRFKSQVGAVLRTNTKLSKVRISDLKRRHSSLRATNMDLSADVLCFKYGSKLTLHAARNTLTRAAEVAGRGIHFAIRPAPQANSYYDYQASFFSTPRRRRQNLLRDYGFL